MERSWKNEGATGGKATSGGGRDNGMNKRNPSPPVAHSCGLDRMVRRGSTVRVRQRASGFSLLSGLSVVRVDDG